VTTSPAFLREIAEQARLAREQMASALARGDDSDAVLAEGRLAELEELTLRATDASLVGTPCWP
jgi:hypothetical protein